MNRLQALAALVPPGAGLVVDVGADHGRVAVLVAATGRATVATERMPGRRAGREGNWVICDGLRAFRAVEVAIVAGMGWRTIASILSSGIRPAVAVLHADDDPGSLRVWLAANGWALDAEDLVAHRLAQVCRAVPGVEHATDLTLRYGPHLLERRDPLARRYLGAQRDRQLRIAEAAGATPAGADARSHVRFLEARLRLWDGAPTGYGDEGTIPAGRPQGEAC